jgi:hypothetical protein
VKEGPRLGDYRAMATEREGAKGWMREGTSGMYG